jgi:hypothetical protein
MESSPDHPHSSASALRDDIGARLPAAAYLRYQNRADGWGAGRQAAFLAHLADNGVVADAARAVGMSVGGGYALRRTARGYAFNLGWEAALIIARRIVADNLMTAAIRGEQSRWVREEGVTTYTRQNTKLSVTLLDRVNPATTLPEILAVATRFDCFLEMIDDGLSAAELWEYFFDDALPQSEIEARERVRAALQLTEDSDIFERDSDEGDARDNDICEEPPIEYKSMDGAPASHPPAAPYIDARLIQEPSTMRKAVLAFAPLSLLALAACGEGSVVDENLKSTLRQSIVASCAATAQGQIPEGVSVDVSKVCDCAADKVMADHSVKDLVANPPSPAEALDKVKACVSEIGPVTIAPPAE